VNDWTLRPLTPADYPQLLAIANQLNSVPVTMDEYVRRIAMRLQEGPFFRLVAEAPGGRICGSGTVFHPVWRAEGMYYVHIAIDPDSRGAGLGSLLWAAVERQARDWGATALMSDVRDDQPADLSFAEHRGFAVTQHYFQSEQDLERFDPSPFLHAITDAQALGYRFITMAEVDDAEGRRRLFELDQECTMDEPSYDPASKTTFADYCRIVFADPVYDPKGVYIAVLGDDWAAMTGLHFTPGTGDAGVFFTGVRRAHRGKRLAQALKLLVARYARQRGARRIITGNNERNPAMLAVNRKFGFTPMPGAYMVERKV
jgi:mycothiol synthase